MLPLCQGTESGKTAAENFDEQDEPGSHTRGEFGLQFGEVGPAVLAYNRYRATDRQLSNGRLRVTTLRLPCSGGPGPGSRRI